MGSIRILIINHDIDVTDYFRRIIGIILPTSEITIASNIDEISDKNIFSVIILDSREAFLKVDTNNLSKVIICSQDSNFVQESIANSRDVILRSHDFYDAISYKFTKKQLV